MMKETDFWCSGFVFLFIFEKSFKKFEKIINENGQRLFKTFNISNCCSGSPDIAYSFSILRAQLSALDTTLELPVLQR